MKILLSIKPKYAEKILSGDKKYEFRRIIFKSRDVNKVIIYASSPVKKIVGEFDIEEILSLDIDLLWQETMSSSGISREFFDSYFNGKDFGHAIKVKNAKRFSKPLDLAAYNIERPPQSFAYINI